MAHERHIRLFCAMILMTYSSFGSSRRPVQILFPGQYHGDEIADDASGPWSAVCGKEFVTVSVKVNGVFDAIVDNDESNRTGKEVVVEGCPEPTVLVRGVSPKAGKLTEAIVQKPDAMLQRIEFKGGIYSIVQSKVGENGYRLELKMGNRTEILYSTDHTDLEGSGTPWDVMWAGDLDGDGKLDVLLGSTYHYNVSETRLFLSSAAQGNEIVKEVALFRSVGC